MDDQLKDKQAEKPDQRAPAPAEPESLWPFGEGIIIFLAATFLSSLPAFFSASAGSVLGLTLISYLLQDACFFLLPVFSLTVLRRLGPEALGMRLPSPRLCLTVGIGGGLVLYGINMVLSLVSAALLPQSWQSRQSILVLFDLADNSLETGLLVFFVIAVSPLAEEMLFRVFMLPPLLARFSRPAAFAIAAGLFALIHFNAMVFLPLFAGGWGFCWIYDKYRNYWYNVIAHSVWNIVALILLYIFSGYQ